MEESLEDWFEREILPHEAALMRYLARLWPRGHEVLDLRQDTYVRVYIAAKVVRPTSPRSFLFTTAHHMVTDRVRRERVVSIEAVGDIDTLNVLVDEISAERQVSAREDLRRLVRAVDSLPPKCREVIWLRRVEGLSHKEIGRRLGINEKTVENHISKGSRLLANYMLGPEAAGADMKRTLLEPQDDTGHGKP